MLKKVSWWLVAVLACIDILLPTPWFADGVYQILHFIDKRTPTPPSAGVYIVLGGGLAKQDNNTIALNSFSYVRVKSAYHAWHAYPLPILTSGVESPWLKDMLAWEHYRHQDAKIMQLLSDSASLNTCENAFFSGQRLALTELGNQAYLVTDRYHMARARRQFAQAGIHTIGIEAPLPWAQGIFAPQANLAHSRRALYEVVALARDVLRPQNDCRKQISLLELQTPRR